MVLLPPASWPLPLYLCPAHRTAGHAHSGPSISADPAHPIPALPTHHPALQAGTIHIRVWGTALGLSTNPIWGGGQASSVGVSFSLLCSCSYSWFGEAPESMLAGWESSGPVGCPELQNGGSGLAEVRARPPRTRLQQGLDMMVWTLLARSYSRPSSLPGESPALKVPTALISGLGSPDSWSLVSPLDHSVGLGVGATRAFSPC